MIGCNSSSRIGELRRRGLRGNQLLVMVMMMMMRMMMMMIVIGVDDMRASLCNATTISSSSSSRSIRHISRGMFPTACARTSGADSPTPATHSSSPRSCYSPYFVNSTKATRCCSNTSNTSTISTISSSRGSSRVRRGCRRDSFGTL